MTSHAPFKHGNTNMQLTDLIGFKRYGSGYGDGTQR